MHVFVGILIGAAAALGALFLYACISEEQTPVPALPPPRPIPNITQMTVAADGTEVFTPTPLLSGRVYKLTFAGTYQYDYGWLSKKLANADAAYQAWSEHDSYQWRYHGLSVDGKRIDLDSWEEDRSIHEYSCLLEGYGKRVPLCLRPPGGPAGRGSIRVQIELLPPGTITERVKRQAAEQIRLQAEQVAKAVARQRWEEEKAAKLAAEAVARQQEEERQEQERIRLHEQDIADQVQNLARKVHHERNFFDPQFRAEYVRQFGEEILSEYRGQWTAEYDRIFSNTDLVCALKSRAPEVLEWYERRNDMILSAERAAIIPGPLPGAPARQITNSTLPYVQQALAELFQFTDLADRTRQHLALDRNYPAHREVLERCARATAFYYQELARFGVIASTPEEAELKFFEACPPPAPSVYQEVMERIRSGQAVPPEALSERLEDIYREKIILQAKRRAAIRKGAQRQRDEIDGRFEEIRREATDLRSFLESISVPIELRDPRQREQDLGLEDELIRLYESKKRVIDFLTKQGELNAIEPVESLYAEEQAKLFNQDSASY